MAPPMQRRSMTRAADEVIVTAPVERMANADPEACGFEKASAAVPVIETDE